MADELRRYLAVFSLGDACRDRLAAIMPSIQRILTAAADGKIELAFRSARGDEFGFYLRSRLHPQQIMARLQSPAREAPFLDNNDSLLVLEIGKDFSAFGRSRAWTWLQRN